MIRIKNLTKVYKGSSEPAVNNISLTVSKGEVFGLLGTNGAGKTTTFSMLCGLFLPTMGNIYIDNKPDESGTKHRLSSGKGENFAVIQSD